MKILAVLVRVIKNWKWPDLLRQTPGQKGQWNGIQFSTEPIIKCDYAIILNMPSENTEVECPQRNIWAIMQEPPNEFFREMHFGDVRYSRIFTSDTSITGRRYVHSQPALPWHVDKDYDFLLRCASPPKERNLSWITSDISAFQGHRARLAFLDKIRPKLKFDLYGRGLSYIEDKWDGLAPYRYSIVVENFRNPYYWSEKIVDCFLSWTMPIYYGCTRISEYFPKESMICIDINDPYVEERIRESVSHDTWRKNLDAIAYARTLAMDHYQLFPFVAKEICQQEVLRNEDCLGQRITIPLKRNVPITLASLFFFSQKYLGSLLKRIVGKFVTSRH